MAEYHGSSLDVSFPPSYLAICALIIMALGVYVFRHRIAEAHDRWRGSRRANAAFVSLSGGFSDDFEAGLNSDNFSITSNISSNDPRHGLLEQAKTEIMRIMNANHITFDEARLQYTQSEMNSNNIDSSGLPRDPKLVTF